mgnify:CR=1 FL=1
MLSIDTSVVVTIAIAVIAAWWGMATLFIGQFEARQTERFKGLQKSMDDKNVDLKKSISDQKIELDAHMTRQDGVMHEVRRLDLRLSESLIEAANRFQTKAESSNQHQQILLEIRAVASRIDALHITKSGGTQ